MGNSFAISAHRLRVAIYGQDPKLISSRLYLGCYCFAWKNFLFLKQSEGTGYDDGDSSWQPSAISLISWQVCNSEARIGLQEISSCTSSPSGFLQAHHPFAGLRRSLLMSVSCALAAFHSMWEPSSHSCDPFFSGNHWKYTTLYTDPHTPKDGQVLRLWGKTPVFMSTWRV